MRASFKEARSELSLSAQEKISACIITFDEEDRIRDCIASLDFCDEVVVVDSHSRDRTREIAADCGARVIERDWPGFVEQKKWAVQQARNDWVLCLDADERLSPELSSEIKALQAQGLAEHAGFRMPRMSYYLGAWIKHGTWWPDYNLRLFDRRCGNWAGHQIHERVRINGPCGTLRGRLLHYPYRSFAEHLTTIDKYTTIMAEALNSQGKRASIGNIVINPWVRFMKFYFLKRGFLDGWRGLVLAYLAAHYVRMKYTKLLVLQRVGEQTD